MASLGHPASDVVIAAAIEVHRALGPGLLESVYQSCLGYELLQRGVEGELIVEVKSVEVLLPIHTAQVLTYLKLSGARQVLLLNFGQLTLKDGLRSFLGRGNEVPIKRSDG